MKKFTRYVGISLVLAICIPAVFYVNSIKRYNGDMDATAFSILIISMGLLTMYLIRRVTPSINYRSGL